MAPNPPTLERDRPDRPQPRFPNFSLNRLLSGRNPAPPKGVSQSAPSPQHPNPPPVPSIEQHVVVDDQLTFSDILDALSQSQHETPLLTAYARAAISRLPTVSPIPRPDVVTPALLRICALSVPSGLRCAGFDLLATYISARDLPLSSIDRTTFWLIVKGAGPHLGSTLLEWQSKATALDLLTNGAKDVNGMQGLIPCVSGWATEAAALRIPTSLTPIPSPDDPSLSGTDAERALVWSFRFLTDVLRHNAQSLSTPDVTQLIDVFDRIVNETLGAGDSPRYKLPTLDNTQWNVPVLTSSPTPTAQAITASHPSFMASLSMSRSHSNLKSSSSSSKSQAEQSRPLLHRRHPSSNSISPTHATPTTPDATATYVGLNPVNETPGKHTQPALQYTYLLIQLLTHSVIPFTCLPQVVKTLTFLLSRGLEVLPRLNFLRTTPAFQGVDPSLFAVENGMLVALQESDTSAIDSRSLNIRLESAIWEVMRNLLSSPTYTVSTARILKKLLLDKPLNDTVSALPLVPLLPYSHSSELPKARYAEGSARVMRLALRRAAEGRLARHWLSNQSGSYAPSGAPTFVGGSPGATTPRGATESIGETNPDIPDVDDILQRAWGKEGEGGAWETERVSAVLPEAVRIWVEMLSGGVVDTDSGQGVLPHGDWEKERVVRECLGIINDVLEEAGLTEDKGSPGSFSSLGIIEGRLVGEVLREAIKCVTKYRPSEPYVLHITPLLSIQPTPLLHTLCKVLSRFPLPATMDAPNAPSSQGTADIFIPPSIHPSLPTILLSVAPYLQDETLAQLISLYTVEGSLNPSTPSWLSNFETLFNAVGVIVTQPVSRPVGHVPRTLARKALSQAITNVYQGVRDYRPHRLALLGMCLEIWEQNSRDEIENEVLEGAWTIMADGIVASAADEEPRIGRPTEGSSTSLRELAAANYAAPNTKIPKDRIDEGRAIELKIRSLICQVARESICPLEASRRRIQVELDAATRTPLGGVPHVAPSSSPGTNSPTRSSAATSPGLPEREQSMPPLMSFFTSLTSSSPSASGKASQAVGPQSTSEDDPNTFASASKLTLRHETVCKSLSAVLTLIQAFQSLAFSPPSSLSSSTSRSARAPASHQCIHVFRDLLALLTPTSASPLTEEEKTWHERATEESSLTGIGQAMCPRARLAILQWLVRLRADRDHRLYVLRDLDAQLEPFAALVGRSVNTTPSSLREADEALALPGGASADEKERELRRNQSLTRKASSGPDGPRRGRELLNKESQPEHVRARALSHGRKVTQSRSRSQPAEQAQRHEPLWFVPENLPFDVPIGTRPSEGMTTYEAGMSSPDVVTASLWLPTSTYICVLLDIVKDELDWEILTYALCHLPLQLANKHLFCGPLTSKVMVKFATTLIECIKSNRLAVGLGRIKYPEVLAVAYHGLAIVASYRRLFHRPLLEALVETFQMGLSRYPATIKPCLHALTLAAFELQPQMTRSLSKIIAQLSLIVTNSAVAIHILELLIILGSIPSLYSNFTEEDYKRVFTVALRYIQHHNQPETPSTPGGSHALSQHLLAIAYYNIYVWFLAVKMPERPKYVPHITRNLLIANDQKRRRDVDEPTEVCFDWLARYTYGDVDPKPTRSLLGEVLNEGGSEDVPSSQKTWIQGNAIVTIRTLRQPNWIEVECRRPSGMTRFHIRIENGALAKLCLDTDVSEAGGETPRVSASASITDLKTPAEDRLEPDISKLSIPSPENKKSSDATTNTVPLLDEDVPSTDAPLSGWVGFPLTPDRLRDMAIDPSFFALQLSPYPDIQQYRSRMVSPTEEFKRTMRTLDRTPVIDSHTIGVLYVGPGQTTEGEILGNRHGSPAYTRFLQGIGRLIHLKGQKDVYTGGLDTYNDEDGSYAYAWWNDIAQILYHTATMMPNRADDPFYGYKKRHVGNDYVRIVWNDSGLPYRFDTLKTEFQFANIVIEPHSSGAVAAYSNSLHENEFFKVSCQRAAGMPEFGPLGEFKLISAESLSQFVREISLLADFFAPVWVHTQKDTKKVEYLTNWRVRLQAIKRLQASLPNLPAEGGEIVTESLMGQEATRDFTRVY